MGRRRILLVDDNERVLLALVRLLERAFDIDVARSAEDAAALLEVWPYDGVVTDYELPGRDGAWLLGVAARKQPRAVRILTSGGAAPAGDFAFLAKPASVP